MKTKAYLKVSSLIGRPAAWLGVPLALILCATLYSQADESFRRGGWSRQPVLVGTWVTEATLSMIPPGFPADGKFEAIEIFNSDGTMTVLSQLPGVTIGNGAWKQMGQGRFTFTFTFYRQDPSSPQKMLAVVVNENVKITGEDTYETSDVIMPLDASNNPLTLCGGVCQFPGRVSATRYKLANFNTVVLP